MNKPSFRSIIFGLLLTATTSFAAPSTLPDQDFPALRENTLAAAIAMDACIVMYYNPADSQFDSDAQMLYGMTAQRLADEWMNALLQARRPESLPFKLYKVDLKAVSIEAIGNAHAETGALLKTSAQPTFVLYLNKGKAIFSLGGPARPDAQSYFVNEMLSRIIATIKYTKGEFMRGKGWFFMNTNVSYVGIADMQQGRMVLNGIEQKVRLATYLSAPYNAINCKFESIYSESDKLIGIIESCGDGERIGYFDHDRTGKMQYRIRYRSGEPGPTLLPTADQ